MENIHSKEDIQTAYQELVKKKISICKNIAFVYTKEMKEIDKEIEKLAKFCDHKDENKNFAFNEKTHKCKYCGKVNSDMAE